MSHNSGFFYIRIHTYLCNCMTLPERSHTRSRAVNSSSHWSLLRSAYWQVNYFWSLLLSCWLIPEAEAAWHDTDQVLCWAFDSDFCCCIGIFMYPPEANKWPQPPSPHPEYVQLSLSTRVYLTFIQWCTLTHIIPLPLPPDSFGKIPTSYLS